MENLKSVRLKQLNKQLAAPTAKDIARTKGLVKARISKTNSMDTTVYPNDETNKLRYIAYVRKSSEEIEKQALSLQAQIRKVKEAFPKLDVTFVEWPDVNAGETKRGRKSYRNDDADDGVRFGEQRSAFEPGRPKFNKMLEAIDAGRFDGIIAWHPDRLSRNEIDAAAVTWRLRQGVIHDIKFAGGYTLEKTAEGIWMFQMVLSQGQYFSEKLSKDIKRGNEEKRQAGGLSGVAPQGYKNNRIDNDTTNVIKDPERFDTIRKAWDMLLTGDYAVPAIHHWLCNDMHYKTIRRKKSGGDELSIQSLYQLFRNVRYAGKVPDPYKEGVFYNSNYPAMITLEEYDRAQDILGGRGCPRFCRGKQFDLRGFINCGCCGAAITAEDKYKKDKDGNVKQHYVYYHCTHRKKGVKCTNRQNVEEVDLLAQLEDLLGKYEIHPKLYEWGLKALDEISAREVKNRDITQDGQFKEIKEIERQMDVLLQKALDGVIDDATYIAKKASLDEKLGELGNESHETIERARNWYEIVGNTLYNLENATTEFKNGDLGAKSRILSALGSNPTLTDGVLRIEEHYWLTPVKENARTLTDKLNSVRTASQQIKKDLEQVIFKDWCWE